MAVFIDEKKCKGCALCLPVCPVQAISMEKSKADIDQNLCTECLACMDECPENAIYQLLQKDSMPAEKPVAEPYLIQRTPSRSDEVLHKNIREKGLFWREGGIFDRIIGFAQHFFSDMSSPGQGRGRGGGRHRGRGKGYRGGRGRR
ncbi:MAG: 4Fe-4S binding protein [Candidatus Aminicenantes bacterium]|nr:4Fe-4S binding protein [Candidatus Aminicenantes bacterium]